MAPGKMRWGDAAESYGSTGASTEAYENGTSTTDLPPPQVFGPDAKGIKTVVEYKYNEEGQKVRITRKTRILRKKKVLSKEMLSRKDWIKFGDAKGILPGTDNLTAVSTDEIFVERPKKLGMKQEEEQVRVDRIETLPKERRFSGAWNGDIERRRNVCCRWEIFQGIETNVS